MADFQVPDLPRFSLHLTVYISKDDVPKFFEAIAPAFKGATEDPDMRYFEMFQDPEDEGKITWVENWEKSPTRLLTENMAKDYMKTYLEVTEPMFVKPREFKILKRVGPPFVYSSPKNVE